MHMNKVLLMLGLGRILLRPQALSDFSRLSRVSSRVLHKMELHKSISESEMALREKISEKGDFIRKMKDTGASKSDISGHVADLLALKEDLGELLGDRQSNVESISKDDSPIDRIQKPTIMMTPDGPMPDLPFGDYQMITSLSETGRKFIPISNLGTAFSSLNSSIWIRGRIHNIRAKGKNVFIVLRGDYGSTVQIVKFREEGDQKENSNKMIKYLTSLSLETVVDVYGNLVSAGVKSCTQNSVEIQVQRVYAASRADVSLPMLVEDASRSERIVEESQVTSRPFPRLGQELRLDNRWIDLRTPANRAIMQVQSGVCQLFREYLYTLDFVEIHTPKLVPGESEGGSEVFRTDYFGMPACLAQSPQIYKQMAISSDMERVFEIGPVFRAENSNTRRHLCEFTGLDLEMGIYDHYNEILRILHGLFKHIFTGLENRYASALASVRLQYDSSPVAFTDEPCIIHWEEAIDMLRKAGQEAADFDDLSGSQELVLGELVKQKYNTDFFIVDRYPSNIRPFYTMPNSIDGRYSNSYDLFLRGQEICSGAQRCHDPDLLEDRIREKGLPVEPLRSYINAFKAGCVPHGGAGIGLERVVFLYLGLDNVRKASMFPRDPRRCVP